MHSMAPWCVLGDFNEIIKQEEKHGRHQRSAKQMEEFKHALEVNGLFDLGWQGTKYTWSNRHTDNTFTKLRLDKVAATKEWIDKFGYQKVEVLATARSDHQLILLSIQILIILKLYGSKFRTSSRAAAKLYPDGVHKIAGSLRKS